MAKNVVFGMVDNLSINLGDQAFTLGCLEFLAGSNIKLLVQNGTQVEVFKSYENVEILYLPRKGKIRNLLFLLKLIGDFKKIDNIYCIGADMLDGSWCEIPKLFRIILKLSKYIAVKTRIVSFSFRETQIPSYKILLNSLGKHAYFYPRDSVSMENIKKEFAINDITLSSDLSFLAKRFAYLPSEIELWLQKQKMQNRKIITICLGDRPSIRNIDFFIKNLADQINTWDDWSVCTVQHIFDESTKNICQKFAELIHLEKYFLNIQDVTIVRRLMEETDMVASCLMHCALGAIAAKRPVVILDYFGKANGLFSDLGLHRYVCNHELDFIPKILETKCRLLEAERDIVKGFEIAQKRAEIVFV